MGFIVNVIVWKCKTRNKNHPEYGCDSIYASEFDAQLEEYKFCWCFLAEKTFTTLK